MKLNTKYVGLKSVDGVLLGKIFYETQASAELDLDRLRRVAEMQWKSAEVSGNQDLIDQTHAEHLRLAYVKVVEITAVEVVEEVQETEKVAKKPRKKKE